MAGERTNKRHITLFAGVMLLALGGWVTWNTVRPGPEVTSTPIVSPKIPAVSHPQAQTQTHPQSQSQIKQPEALAGQGLPGSNQVSPQGGRPNRPVPDEPSPPIPPAGVPPSGPGNIPADIQAGIDNPPAFVRAALANPPPEATILLPEQDSEPESEGEEGE